MEIPIWLVFFGFYLSLVYGIFRLFKELGDTVKEETKISTSLWLLNLESKKKYSNWPSQFAELFDKLFFEKHWSWKCYKRSFIATVLIYIVFNFVYAIFYLFGADPLKLYLQADLHDVVSSIDFQYLNIIIPLLILVFLLNSIGDYFSLLSTRFFINKMSNSTNKAVILFYLIIDFFVTFLIFIVLFFTATTLYVSFFLKYQVAYGSIGQHSIFKLFGVADGIVWKYMKADIIEILSLNFSGAYPSKIFIFTTFLTSIWLWLYALSGFTIKAFNLSNKVFNFSRNHLDIENKPFRSLGVIAVVITTLGFVLLFLRSVVT